MGSTAQGGQDDYCRGYSADVDVIRQLEYPMLENVTYLDHAGTTLYAKSLIESFSCDLTSNLFGNPHSMSASSQLSTRRVDDVRLRVLRFFNADPDDFDLIFVANATAAIKLVADTMRDYDPSGFWYGYHVDSHTSLVGVREVAQMGSRCFLNDDEVQDWISEFDTNVPDTCKAPKLVAFPAQSNLNGRRLPLRWCEEIRNAGERVGASVFSLLDAASFASTAPLDLTSTAPDFTALSFYKIFGFPDLGALIVRKNAAHVFERRKYFGGGTVGMTLVKDIQWHAKKDDSLHEKLEDGTLPFHNIIALDWALDVHQRLYGSMANISKHTCFLAKQLHDRLSCLEHFNGVKVCQIHKAPKSDYLGGVTQGGIVAFNLRNSSSKWVGRSEVEKLAAARNIQIRTGFVCNPGGAVSLFNWSVSELLRQFALGVRCGDHHDFMDGKPTGVLRVSLGAMSSIKDIDAMVAFIDEFYVEKTFNLTPVIPQPIMNQSTSQARFLIESLTVYPIKSCAGFKVPEGKRWKVNKKGLAWDREWCLIHQGTGAVLNQKRYPRMALIRPYIDLNRDVLRITCGETEKTSAPTTIEISLSRKGSDFISASLCQNTNRKSALVCGDRAIVQTYTSSVVSTFFSDFLGVPCTLARFAQGVPFPRSSLAHHRSVNDNTCRQRTEFAMPGSFPDIPPGLPSFPDAESPPQERNAIGLSNESPILIISRSSVNRLNETIKANAKPTSVGLSKAVAADVFRANIVVAENLSPADDAEQPYVEDDWISFTTGSQKLQFDILGSCQRCQMVCVDQFSGLKTDEPFSTLAKTRKTDGKVYFGRHAALSEAEICHPDDCAHADDGDEEEEIDDDANGQLNRCRAAYRIFIMVGDPVMPHYS